MFEVNAARGWVKPNYIFLNTEPLSNVHTNIVGRKVITILYAIDHHNLLADRVIFRYDSPTALWSCDQPRRCSASQRNPNACKPGNRCGSEKFK